jgi:hypothetical protein
VTQRLGNDHDFDWATPDSAHFFGQRGAQDAKLVGETAPDVGLPTRPSPCGGSALLEVVSGRQELAQPVAQQFLFFAQVEVHLQPQCRLGQNVPLNFIAAGID